MVTFTDLQAEERIVESIRFMSDDLAFQKPMTLTTLFEPAREGTKVTLSATNVPSAISAKDHRDGMLSSLRILARLTE